MKNKAILIILILGLASNNLKAQHEDVFPDLNGQELLNALVANYKPAAVLEFGNSRDTLFSRIYSHNDSLYCVYTGHSIYLNPNLDPTVTAYMNGGPNGINTEHTYPQAMGASEGNARADMHHLYPTRIDVNADRGSFPFGEVPDNQAQSWYNLGQNQNNIPTVNIDWYSELGNGKFEPREDHKGNVARAMFYFYTVYKTEADLADASFFPGQRATLCDWHYAEPVDFKEWQRSNKIAQYQDGKANPFVLDCTLAARAYCQEYTGMECITAISEESESRDFVLEQNFPNPFSGSTNISYRLDKKYEVALVIYDFMGRETHKIKLGHQAAGNHEIQLNANVFTISNNGIYFYQLRLRDEDNSFSVVKKMVRM